MQFTIDRFDYLFLFSLSFLLPSLCLCHLTLYLLGKQKAQLSTYSFADITANKTTAENFPFSLPFLYVFSSLIMNHRNFGNYLNTRLLGEGMDIERTHFLDAGKKENNMTNMTTI